MTDRWELLNRFSAEISSEGYRVGYSSNSDSHAYYRPQERLLSLFIASILSPEIYNPTLAHEHVHLKSYMLKNRGEGGLLLGSSFSTKGRKLPAYGPYELTSYEGLFDHDELKANLEFNLQMTADIRRLNLDPQIIVVLSHELAKNIFRTLEQSIWLKKHFEQMKVDRTDSLRYVNLYSDRMYFKFSGNGFSTQFPSPLKVKEAISREKAKEDFYRLIDDHITEIKSILGQTVYIVSQEKEILKLSEIGRLLIEKTL